MSQLLIRGGISLLLSLVLAQRGYKKKSLSKDGAIAAFFTGLITTFCGYRFAFVLLSFFVSSSIFTKYGSHKKEKVEDEFRVGGQRGYIQVLSNSATASLVCLIYLLQFGMDEIVMDFSQNPFGSFLLAAFLGHYACCNGDTWASELGILSKSDPVLCTSFQFVPRGTNGGMSVIGTVASALGGLFIGLSWWISTGLFAVGLDNNYASQWPIIFISLFAGFIGSFIDSLLGANFQFSGWDKKQKKVVNKPTENTSVITGSDILDNNQVNFISALITAVFTSLLSWLLM
eukprot:TRINITY_DN5821_c0_g1_i1.p1 TRINITY_DN5821_c0_g1~~TRINITY_DN5821_c0_g1_i1.p1  ORF type:complete len:288 (-),score=67.48 TRINITY_DN5821_c0_g1_i1:153-1016(-)